MQQATEESKTSEKNTTPKKDDMRSSVQTKSAPPQESFKKPLSKNQKIEHVPNSDINIESKHIMGEPDTKIFSIKFDYEDKYIAAACEKGEVRVYNTSSGKMSYQVNATDSVDGVGTPFSYVRWRPPGNFKTNKVFLTVNAKGLIQHHHLSSGKVLSTIQEESFDPQLYCADYNNDATQFGVCGSEPVIRIYDEEKRQKVLTLGNVESFPPGHNSRVFCIKWDKEDPNRIYTGGWDYRVIIWDLREGKPIRSSGGGIHGPLICGDGIDICNNLILTSSWTQTNQLQVWDKRNCKLVYNIDWDNPIKSFEPIFLYAGQFSKRDGTLILAGGSNCNEVKIFDRQYQSKCCVCVTDLCRDVDTVDFANNGGMFAISGGDGYVRLFNMDTIA